MKKRTKVMLILIVAALIIGAVFLLCFLRFSKKSIGDGLSWARTDQAGGATAESVPVLGATPGYIVPMSFSQKGLFYFSDANLGYYDTASGDCYVICSEPRCFHSSEKCNSYIGNYRICGGYALYQGRIYLAAVPVDSDQAQLISMDLQGKEKEVAAQWDAGEIARGSWHIIQFDNVYYDNGYAYVRQRLFRSADEGENTNGEQLLAIRLSDGEVIPLTERVEYNDHLSEMISVQYELITSSSVITSIRQHETPGSENTVITYYMFDPASGQVAGERTLPLKAIGDEDFADEYGYHEDLGYVPPVEFLGEFQGKWLLKENRDQNPARGASYSLYDPASGEKQVFFETENGDITFTERHWGDLKNVLWDGTYLLGTEKLSEQEEQVFRLSPTSGERTDLYVRNREFSSDIATPLKESGRMELLGETEEFFIGQIFTGGEGGYFFIEKEDFLADNLEKAERIVMK